MITPKDMEKFTENNIVKMYEKLNQDLTRTIINELRKGGDISSYTKAQIRTLKKLGGRNVFKETVNKMSKLSKKEKNELNKLFDEISTTSLKGYSKTFKAKGIDYELSPEMIKVLDQANKETKKILSKWRNPIANRTKKLYIDAMDELYKEVATGAYDYNTALKRTINGLAKKGITFKTVDGRKEQIDVVVKRTLFTEIQTTANNLAEEVGDMIGANCVVIGHSGSCRPSHNVIDGVTMSLKEFKKYKYLTEEYNCNHIVNYDWQPEFDEKGVKPIYSDEHLSDAKVERNYKMQQKANYYARQVRSKKDEIASGDTTEKAKMRLSMAQKKYREYCKKNGLDIDYTRTWKVGYNK